MADRARKASACSVAVVGVQVSACGLDGRAAEDLLEDVERDAGICHPCRAGVPEAVSGEVGQAEIADDLAPVRRVPHGRGRERAARRAASMTKSE